jgi:hypothetical protein
MTFAASLQILGVLSEVWGVLLMANGIAGVTRWRKLPRLLLRALVKRPVLEGKLAQALDQEDRATTLRGLAYLVVGFVLQFTGLLVALSD